MERESNVPGTEGSMEGWEGGAWATGREEVSGRLESGGGWVVEDAADSCPLVSGGAGAPSDGFASTGGAGRLVRSARSRGVYSVVRFTLDSPVKCCSVIHALEVNVSAPTYVAESVRVVHVLSTSTAAWDARLFAT